MHHGTLDEIATIRALVAGDPLAAASRVGALRKTIAELVNKELHELQQAFEEATASGTPGSQAREEALLKLSGKLDRFEKLAAFL